MMRMIPVLTGLLLALPAVASDGVLEINQTCAIGPGCFTGDSPGWPVTISVRGSYQLTSNLGFSSGLDSPSENFIEISGDDVQLDLNGFSLRCSNLLTGTPCPAGTVVGIRVENDADRVRVHDGTIFGMPDDGIDADGAAELQVERITVTSVGGDGISAGSNTRIERCTVTGSGEDGIAAAFGAILTHNVVAQNGSDGIAVSGGSNVFRSTSRNNGGIGIKVVGDAIVEANDVIGNGGNGIEVRLDAHVSRNASRGNGGVGIEAGSGSIVESNTVSGNQIGIGWRDWGGLARDNTIFSNTSFGMSQVGVAGAPGFVFRNNVLRGNNRGDANPQTSGGMDAGGNYCGGTPGCP